jgi:hypothetical protein
MKNHSKQLERRKSSTSGSITSNGDFFSEDVSCSIYDYHWNNLVDRLIVSEYWY